MQKMKIRVTFPSISPVTRGRSLKVVGSDDVAIFDEKFPTHVTHTELLIPADQTVQIKYEGLGDADSVVRTELCTLTSGAPTPVNSSALTVKKLGLVHVDEPAKHDTTPAKDDTTTPAKHDTTTPAKDDTTKKPTTPAKHDATTPAKHDTTTPAKHDTTTSVSTEKPTTPAPVSTEKPTAPVTATATTPAHKPSSTPIPKGNQ